MKSCLVLTLSSHARLMRASREISLQNHGAALESPIIHAHHLTLSFKGELPVWYRVGQKYKFNLVEYGISDKAIALFAENVPGCESGNPHITLAVAKSAKPVDSLAISQFYPMMKIEIEGVFRFGESCFSGPLEK